MLKKLRSLVSNHLDLRIQLFSLNLDLVSISGPNGSGKSNILDAIIFAMGENKPKVMRVDKLEIFDS